MVTICHLKRTYGTTTTTTTTTTTYKLPDIGGIISAIGQAMERL